MGTAGAGCCGILVLLIALGLTISAVEWAARHAAPVLLVLLVIGGAVAACSMLVQRQRRARVQRRAAASLRVESARTGLERRLTIAQEVMRLAGQALPACSAHGDTPAWTARLDDIAAEAELLRRSAFDPQAARLPDPAPRDRLDETTLNEAVEALCALLSACHAASLSNWQTRPEQLRVLQRERTRLLVAQDSIGQRLQP
jgi:hypothetical protein